MPLFSVATVQEYRDRKGFRDVVGFACIHVRLVLLIRRRWERWGHGGGWDWDWEGDRLLGRVIIRVVVVVVGCDEDWQGSDRHS